MELCINNVLSVTLISQRCSDCQLSKENYDILYDACVVHGDRDICHTCACIRTLYNNYILYMRICIYTP